MIDFAALVLGPAMAVFGGPVTYTPSFSQPGAAPFTGRGVFAQKPVRIEMEGGGYASTLETSFGIRLSDYPVAPKQGDSFVRDGTTWFVWDVNPDGQGGADLRIMKQSPSAQ